jgi:hypothetical protein
MHESFITLTLKVAPFHEEVMTHARALCGQRSSSVSICVHPWFKSVSQPQKLAQLQLQLPPFFAPGCTQLHLIAVKRPKTKIFL